MSTSDCRQPAGRAGARWARAFIIGSIMALALAFGAGAWAQTSTPIDFATTNLLSGVSIALNVSYTDPSGVATTTTVSFTSPGPSAPISVQPGSVVTYSGFQANIPDGTSIYALDRVSPASPITTSLAGTPVHVQARYGLLVDFATSGLPGGTQVNVNVSSFTSARNQLSAAAIMFASPGPDSSVNGTISTKPGTTVSFSYPASITAADGKTYPLVSVSPTSGFTAGAAGTSTHVVATYGSMPPAVTAAASQSATEGASTSFDLGSFVDPDGGPWSVDVDWGDASAHSTFTASSAGSLGTQSHTYADSGAYTATVKVTDTTNLSDSESFAVTVANVAPTPSISGAPASSPEGTSISLTASATDPSSVDTTAGFTFNWSVSKDNSPFTTGSGASFSFTPDDDGNYVVTLTAADKDGDTGTDSKTIDVSNAAPSAAINGAPPTSPEGTAISLTSTVSDPSSADTTAGLTLSWSVTKNSSPFATGSGASFSFTPDDDGTYVVTLTAKDKDEGTGTDSKTITVGDSAPSVADLTANSTVLVNQSLAASTTFSDPGADYAWQATFNWGDGSTPVLSPVGPTTGPAQNVPLSLSHSYSSNGTFQIRVDVTDKNSVTGSSSPKSVNVLYKVAALFAQSGSGKAYKKGSTIPIKLQILDFNGNVSSPAITVKAVNKLQLSGSASADVLDSGNANPDLDFRFDSGLQGYVFNLSTKDLSTGTWKLLFTVNNQPDNSYSVTFEIR